MKFLRKSIFYIDLLLKLANPASIFFNTQIEKLFKTIFSIVFNPNHQHFVSSLSYAKHTYFYLFLWYSNSLADILPNQELSVLYGALTLNYEEQISLYVRHMFRVNMTRDLAHLQLCDLQGEIRPICRISDLQEERILISRT